MATEERNTWVTAIVTTGASIVYFVIILRRMGDYPIADIPYVRTMLWMIGASIIATIVGSIIAAIGAAIAMREDSERTDVRDKEIGRFGEYVGFYVLSVGILGALVLSMTKAEHFWIANAIYLAFVVSNLVSSTVKIVVYRRGFLA